MSKFSVVIPLLHKECKLLPNVPLLFDDTTSVRSVKSEHIGAIISKRRGLSEILNSKTKCILIQTGDSEASHSTIERAALSGSFILNIFSKFGASVCENGFVIKHVRSHSVTKIIDLSESTITSRERFEIEPNTTPAAVKTLYTSVNEALKKDPSLAITIRRFNGALSKSISEDKVIDITICLESMFNSQTEISFRFSLYNALLAESETDARHVLFKSLKRLYSERSNLVHGSRALDTNWVEQNWDAIVRATKRSLLKKIEYLQDNTTNQWQEHLDRLALGA